jgi:hypothetical protein
VESTGARLAISYRKRKLEKIIEVGV